MGLRVGTKPGLAHNLSVLSFPLKSPRLFASHCDSHRHSKDGPPEALGPAHPVICRGLLEKKALREPLVAPRIPPMLRQDEVSLGSQVSCGAEVRKIELPLPAQGRASE